MTKANQQRLKNFSQLNQARAIKARALQLKNYLIDTNGCWIWQGKKDKDGYGKLKRHGRDMRAHRFFYEWHNGSIKPELLVCHKCDQPSCVNPDHLFVGTQLDNEKDKDQKGRRPPSPSITHPHALLRGEQHPHSKFNTATVIEIRKSKLTAKQLAEKYNVNASTIHRILNKSFWKHI